MQIVEDDNARWLLEQERDNLIKQQHTFDMHYGLYLAGFLHSLQTLALFAHLTVMGSIVFYKTNKTRTNSMIGIWAFLNSVNLTETLLASFTESANADVDNIIDMMTATSRTYGTALAVVWVYSKFLPKPNSAYDFLHYALIVLPLCGLVGFVIYYTHYNKYIYEVYGPGCDVLHVATYIVVGLTFLFGKILANSTRNTSYYPLLVSLVNLFCNFPICLLTIYVRFSLDISHTYRFHIWLIDFAIAILSCSSGFIVLFLVIIYNDTIKNAIFRPRKQQDLI